MQKNSSEYSRIMEFLIQFVRVIKSIWWIEGDFEMHIQLSRN